MPKAVIFDMDGVIIDSELVHHEIEQAMFKQLGLNISHSEHMAFTGMAGDAMWKTLRERYHVEMSVAEINAIVRRQFYAEFDAPDGRIQLIDGVRDLIDRCAAKGLKLAVASSSSSAYVRMIAHRFGLAASFQRLCGGDIVLHSKPAPDLFLYAAEQLAVKPADCVVIEDSANGVRAGKAAGMTVIGFRNLNSGNQDLSPADRIVSSMAEIDLSNADVSSV